MDWTALRVSLWLGAGTIAILLPCGVWFGRLLAFRRFRGKVLVEALVTVPLVLPPTVPSGEDCITISTPSAGSSASR